MISAELGSSLEGYVTDLVAQGRYGSKSEVLREGVRLVQDRERERALLCAALDQALVEERDHKGEPAQLVFDQLEARYSAMIGA
ncbi:MAG: type II toxin-antitoxin system ParD family antitoxin [Propionibacteriaceae bacterium]|nr:type II toxin-antitoxin system ParD family antitoxin [Propionibacteriaceae bacterium]